ncbi:hypothetical protein BDB00DRAFT_819438 [Zychaea mexicana]|uniref:uncharacterized protein n=1 Tax=Zychaea mexicana TaxID=64656 RepID=UPI0022FEDDBF|nr:uncharacterized protein BDB00DRAFT_819438 [Zychaea mexicana]KAI9494259.1 hypothetical protein BDB00DRAFT_819438 [Zychaea mexicana]
MAPQEQERIYFIGGTGGVGSKAVQDVLDKGYLITIYTRQPAKSTLNGHPQVTLVQGDYDDLTPFEKTIGGHSRLFLLVSTLVGMPKIKSTLARMAYSAGVKQIVDISSLTCDVVPHTGIGQAHLRSEEAIRAVQPKTNGSYVSLRPWRFMSNHHHSKHAIKTQNAIVGTAAPDCVQGWISPNDIGALAAIVLSDPIEKHDGTIYLMIGQLLTAAERAQALSKALGRTITYKQWSLKEQYDLMTAVIGAPHKIAYDLASDILPDTPMSPGLSLVLGREPETLDEWLAKNKDDFN